MGCREEKRSGWGDTDEAGKDVGMLMPEQLDPVWEKLGAIISSGFRGSQAGSLRSISIREVSWIKMSWGWTPHRDRPVPTFPAVQTADWHP